VCPRCREQCSPTPRWLLACRDRMGMLSTSQRRACHLLAMTSIVLMTYLSVNTLFYKGKYGMPLACGQRVQRQKGLYFQQSLSEPLLRRRSDTPLLEIVLVAQITRARSWSGVTWEGKHPVHFSAPLLWRDWARLCAGCGGGSTSERSAVATSGLHHGMTAVRTRAYAGINRRVVGSGWGCTRRPRRAVGRSSLRAAPR
jgi:hypothetical protein